MGEGVVTQFASDVSGNGSLQQKRGSRVALESGVGGKILNHCGVAQVSVLCLHLLLVFGDENKRYVLFLDFSHHSRIMLILQVMMKWCRR